MILQYPNDILSKESQNCDKIALETFLPHFKTLVEKYKDLALGLAAPQTGLNYNIVWIKDFGYLINPKIVSSKTEIEALESCLSVSGKTFKVKRFKEISIVYRDEKFKICRKTFKDQLAIVVQHEIDHLRGLCIPDVGKDVTETIEIEMV